MHRISLLACILAAAALCSGVDVAPRSNIRYDPPGSHLKAAANLGVSKDRRGQLGSRNELGGHRYSCNGVPSACRRRGLLGRSPREAERRNTGSSHNRVGADKQRRHGQTTQPGGPSTGDAQRTSSHNQRREYMGGGGGSGSSFGGGGSSHAGQQRRGQLGSRNELGGHRYDTPGSQLKEAANHGVTKDGRGHLASRNELGGHRYDTPGSQLKEAANHGVTKDGRGHLASRNEFGAHRYETPESHLKEAANLGVSKDRRGHLGSRNEFGAHRYETPGSQLKEAANLGVSKDRRGQLGSRNELGGHRYSCNGVPSACRRRGLLGRSPQETEGHDTGSNRPGSHGNRGHSASRR